MATFNDSRIRAANSRNPDPARDYVLYWMQAYRRLDHNHALDYALHWARRLKKPLIVYEGLRSDYPWASARLHGFMLEGMLDNARHASKLGINYWPYVETPDQPARGLLLQLSEKACLVVTDDYPAFIVPGQTAALAAKVDVAMYSIDGNSIVPLKLLGEAVAAAAHLRPRIHRLFAEAWQHRAAAAPDFPAVVRKAIEPPFRTWELAAKARKSKNLEGNLDAFIAALPIDQSVKKLTGAVGGSTAGRTALQDFIKHKLPRYAEGRNQPNDPQQGAASGLSPWLRHGHLSIEEVIQEVLGADWTVDQINAAAKGKREGFFGPDANVNGFLDEAITWRDVGYHWCHFRAPTAKLKVPNSQAGYQLSSWGVKLSDVLPSWAKTTLSKHARDKRKFIYSLREWEAAETHDPLWNAAQRELMAAGHIHNYLRMLWGKKVIEWSASPEEAYFILEHLNNKYGIDGRDPNSYTGILWCFGLFDRPWPPERDVFGNVRYMSSENTAKKFKLDGYYDYVASLTGQPARQSLFSE